jgi:dynein heavy chain
LETLFDMQKSQYKQIKECNNELVLLKQLWDLISLIDYQFDNWKSTLWENIDTENLMQLIREMQTKQCNPQSPANKEIKSWKSFVSLNDRVKNMNTILPLISQLHSKFMQERHWKKLMQFTHQNIAFQSPKFCLEDLIKLELHKYAEEVTELVDGAQKEAKIEIKLNNIQTIWEEQSFEFKEYKEVPVLGAMDETVEFVEQHSMELMGMLSSKDVEEFKDRVLHWQKNLKTVDSVINIWVKVQRAWQRLEPIFLASEDIRAQLPDDTRRFETVDGAFKEMMREAREDPGVVVACTFEGREELLTGFFNEIELCQKALSEYLGQKRKIFPRFYFVSEQALLDILSNGNNPEKVDEYLGDCFDGLKCLEFDKSPGQPTPAKTTVGMWSKENEHVSFNTPFTMNGAVENYLCELERKIQTSLGEILETAWETACQWGIEKDRHIWLEDYCAQIALLGTQILWTEETIRAFDELEGGRETAMTEHLTLIVTRIGNLIERVRQDLSGDLRMKIITVITIDVHERDVVRDFVARKITDQGLFAWASQLKFYLEKKSPKDTNKVCISRICDW